MQYFELLLDDPVPNQCIQLSRRSWSGHPLAKETVCAAMAAQPKLRVTIPHEVTNIDLIDQVLQD